MLEDNPRKIVAIFADKESKNRDFMELIEPFRLSKVPLGELNGMMRQVAGWFASLETTHAPLQEDIRRLQASADALNTCLYHDRGEEEVQALQEADRQRIEAWRLLRAYVKAMQGHPEAAVARAAQAIYQQIRERGNVVALPQLERSTSLHILAKGLAEESEACRLLALEAWLERLQTHMARYDECYQALSQQQGTLETGQARQLRHETEQAYRAVCLRINAIVLCEGDAPYAELIGRLNTLQREHTRLRKFREAMKDNRNDEKNGPEESGDEKIA